MTGWLIAFWWSYVFGTNSRLLGTFFDVAAFGLLGPKIAIISEVFVVLSIFSDVLKVFVPVRTYSYVMLHPNTWRLSVLMAEAKCSNGRGYGGG